MPDNEKKRPSPYGSVKFTTIDEYHQSVPAGLKSKLDEMREIIRGAAPKAEEVISYNMPAFRQGQVLVYYAMSKNHLGFYPTNSPITAFAGDLEKYVTSKGAIQFPLDKPLPKTLIRKIVKFRLDEVAEWMMAKKAPAKKSAVKQTTTNPAVSSKSVKRVAAPAKKTIRKK